jgi:hypothetical protein
MMDMKFHLIEQHVNEGWVPLMFSMKPLREILNQLPEDRRVRSIKTVEEVERFRELHELPLCYVTGDVAAAGDWSIAKT